VLLEQTLGGLRFLRNQTGRGTGPGELIETGSTGASTRRITGWRWRPAPEPAPGSLSPRGHAWELTRDRAYQAHLAGHTLGETLGRAATFLTLTGTTAASATETSEPTTRG
jgi:hypothetical protein